MAGGVGDLVLVVEKQSIMLTNKWARLSQCYLFLTDSGVATMCCHGIDLLDGRRGARWPEGAVMLVCMQPHPRAQVIVGSFLRTREWMHENREQNTRQTVRVGPNPLNQPSSPPALYSRYGGPVLQSYNYHSSPTSPTSPTNGEDPRTLGPSNRELEAALVLSTYDLPSIFVAEIKKPTTTLLPYYLTPLLPLCLSASASTKHPFSRACPNYSLPLAMQLASEAIWMP